MIPKLINIDSLKDEILDKVDIVELIQNDLSDAEWKENGDNVWTFSPFRDDGAKPSFSVSGRLQIFKDFGGDKAGNAISWMMNYHGLSFKESLVKLANIAKVDLTKYTKNLSPEEAQEHRYTSIVHAVSKACTEQLFGNSELLRRYKQETGFNDEQIKAYGVGYSPGTDFVVGVAFRSIPNVTNFDINKLELNRKDMFENALIYPIRDATGTTKIFYTKPFNVRDGATYKYLGNSKDHPLFSDSLLFGFDVIRKKLRENKFSITLCEGFKQAISTRGVACMGTSISTNQIEVLKDYKVKEVNICFDGDDAGRNASSSLIENLNRWSGLFVKIIRTPLGRQIDEIIRDEDYEEFEAL